MKEEIEKRANNENETSQNCKEENNCPRKLREREREKREEESRPRRIHGDAPPHHRRPRTQRTVTLTPPSSSSRRRREKREKVARLVAPFPCRDGGGDSAASSPARHLWGHRRRESLTLLPMNLCLDLYLQRRTMEDGGSTEEDDGGSTGSRPPPRLYHNASSSCKPRSTANREERFLHKVDPLMGGNEEG
ncbi:hypothetical protein ACS0TY_001465 [Phlomoides rotata]